MLAVRLGLSNFETTMIYVHAVRKQKIEATVKLYAYVAAARTAKRCGESKRQRVSNCLRMSGGNPI